MKRNENYFGNNNIVNYKHTNEQFQVSVDMQVQRASDRKAYNISTYMIK
jgi:hypothetical protein